MKCVASARGALRAGPQERVLALPSRSPVSCVSLVRACAKSERARAQSSATDYVAAAVVVRPSEVWHPGVVRGIIGVSRLPLTTRSSTRWSDEQYTSGECMHVPNLFSRHLISLLLFFVSAAALSVGQAGISTSSWSSRYY